ncbi:MAG: hypothetical protein SFY92_11305, partial [Verrucomicrobiae bacterium]|nr:hypothetical protein [Verrucomicrobiae bacterium]
MPVPGSRLPEGTSRVRPDWVQFREMAFQTDRSTGSMLQMLADDPKFERMKSVLLVIHSVILLGYAYFFLIVVPVFMNIFNDFGAKLPFLTQLMNESSGFFRTIYGFYLGAALIALFIHYDLKTFTYA